MSPWHWALVIGVAILLFGAKRLPDAARSLGRSARILRAELHGPEPAAATAERHGPEPSSATAERHGPEPSTATAEPHGARPAVASTDSPEPSAADTPPAPHTRPATPADQPGTPHRP